MRWQSRVPHCAVMWLSPVVSALTAPPLANPLCRLTDLLMATLTKMLSQHSRGVFTLAADLQSGEHAIALWSIARPNTTIQQGQCMGRVFTHRNSSRLWETDQLFIMSNGWFQEQKRWALSTLCYLKWYAVTHEEQQGTPTPNIYSVFTRQESHRTTGGRKFFKNNHISWLKINPLVWSGYFQMMQPSGSLHMTFDATRLNIIYSCRSTISHMLL